MRLSDWPRIFGLGLKPLSRVSVSFMAGRAEGIAAK